MLCSSASALRGDPTNKEGLASVHLRFDEAFEISRCEFGRARPVSVRVDAGGEQGRDEEHPRKTLACGLSGEETEREGS